MKQQEIPQSQRLRDFPSFGSGRRIRTAKNAFYEQITSNYVIFSSETIKHGISQSSCFIEDGPLKGQDKGQSQRAWKEYHAMEITYTNHEGFYLPNLTLPRKEEASFGRYGRLRLKYLKEHRRALYINLLTSGELAQHLNEIDRQAREMLELLVKQIAQEQDITEQMKAEDQMAWVGAMNNIRSAAEEVVIREVVFS